MSTARKPIDWWRWAGRGFLLFILTFTVIPMIWMLLTSIKTQFEIGRAHV